MKKQRIFSLNMNNYERINPQELLVQSQRWITNGTDNMFFNKVENAYLGSTTNTAIIDAFSNYIIGDGLEDINGFDVESILSEEDQRLAITDFKIHGACAFQVIYNVGKKVAELCYIPTKSLAIARQGDITEKPEAYYYSFDWQYKNKYRPELIPAFGYGDGIQSEVLYIKRHSPQPLYALPDWFSGIQFCQTEEEMSNYYIKHISNNFSAGKIININQGIPDNDEAQEEAERAIKSQLSGSNNAGDCLISFNENKENATTVDTIEITDAYGQFQFLSSEAEKRIMMSHKVNDPSLFGLPLPSGFNSSADLRVQSLKDLYRSQINPIRKTIIRGLEQVFQTISSDIILEFRDFEELKVDSNNQTQVSATMPGTMSMASVKVSFDFDGSLTTDVGKHLLELAIAAGKVVYIISARRVKSGMISLADKYNIPHNRVFATGSNSNKVKKVLDLGITTHYDNNQDVVDKLPGIGKKI